jgi:predicted RND superfamily exporter protein
MGRFLSQDYAKLVSRAARWCMDHPAATGLISAFALAVACGGATAVRIDPSPEAYLANTPEWSFYRSIDREYEIGETIVIAFREPGGTVFDVETVTAVAELDRVLAGKRNVERVLSIASATALGKDRDTVDLRPLLPHDPITQAIAVELGNKIQSHPVYSQVLVDDRHETTFIFLQLSSASLELARDIRDEVDRFASKHRSVHLAGSPVTKEAIAAGVEHDVLLFFPAAMILLMVLLWISFNDLIASLIPLTVVGCSSMVVVGALAFAGTPLNMATAMVPTLILVVGLADCVHFLAELKRQFARNGDRRASVLATVEAVALPCLLTAVTSAVGFMALSSSRIGPLREFGYVTAIGLLVAYASSMLLTPLLVMLLQYPRAKVRAFPAAPLLGRGMRKLAVLGHRHLLVTIGVAGLLFGCCVAATANLAIDSNFVRYFDDDHRLRRDLATIERTLGGVDVIELLVDAPEEDTFKEPAGLAKIDAIAVRLRKLEGVSRVFTLSDYLRFTHTVVEGGRADLQGPLPQSPEKVAQLALLDPTAFSALTNQEMNQARITMQVNSMSTEDVLALERTAGAEAEKVLAGSGLTVRFTGLPILFAGIVTSMVDEALQSFAVAAALIFLAMMIALRSPAMAGAAMIPNILIVGLTFGTMAVLGMKFDTNSTFVVCLGIAIAVDHTIHVATRYQRAREEGSPTPASAVQYALTHAGFPVVMTSLLLAVGCSVLCLSSFEPTFRVGMLSAIMVGYAVVLDLCLLPALLITADRLEKRYEDRNEAKADARFREITTTLIPSPPKK